MAYVGDVTPYDRRQPVLGRYLTGQITGQLFGQAAGGVLGDLFGWRNVFFIRWSNIITLLRFLIRIVAAPTVWWCVFSPIVGREWARSIVG